MEKLEEVELAFEKEKFNIFNRIVHYRDEDLCAHEHVPLQEFGEMLISSMKNPNCEYELACAC